MARKTSKAGDARGVELELLQKNKQIRKLRKEFKFFLYGKTGKAIATYTADYIYQLLVPMYGFPALTNIIEEYKGSKHMWAYKRSDYPLRRRWVITDYPMFQFIENINGRIVIPKVKYPKENT